MTAYTRTAMPASTTHRMTVLLLKLTEPPNGPLSYHYIRRQRTYGSFALVKGVARDYSREKDPRALRRAQKAHGTVGRTPVSGLGTFAAWERHGFGMAASSRLSTFDRVRVVILTLLGICVGLMMPRVANIARKTQ